MEELKKLDLADMAKQHASQMAPLSEEAQASIPVVTEHKAEVPVVYAYPIQSVEPAQAVNTIVDSAPHVPVPVAITPDVDLKAEAPNLIRSNQADRQTYMRNLIMQGFSPEDAKVATDAYFEKMSISAAETAEQEASSKEAEETHAVIEIAKDNANELGLTEEEHEKLHKVSAIKLVLVESAELKNIRVEPIAAEHKADYISSIEGALSKYTVPLPTMGDFASFRGAQIIQLANAISYEDDRLEEGINKKASLVYDKLQNSPLLKKYDNFGKVIMDYQEFTNKFPYGDLDIALYGVLCASTMEETTTELKCSKCQHVWEQPYNTKTLMQPEGFPDHIKSRIDKIIENRTDERVLSAMYDDMHNVRRYKSPFTNNIYDINPPSVARAMSIMKAIDQKDQVMVYNSALALYLNQIFIYNKATDSYVSVSEEDVSLMLDTVLTLPDTDMRLLLEQIKNELSYTSVFQIKTTCPSCKAPIIVPITIEQLVFLRAQDSLKEIR